jgi:pimeloyl-ACP methyl ester carboxylesterase
LIDRGFIRINSGLVHYRTCKTQQSNNTLPLYIAHAGPGSSLGLVPLIAELGKSRSVIAPDMLGNGDSEAPKIERTTLGFNVDCVS